MKSESSIGRFQSYLDQDIRKDVLLEAELLTLAFATGIQDTASFLDYHCFTSNQTGNTVLLAIGAAHIDHGAIYLQNIGISLGMFVAGVWVTGQTGHILGSRSRWWLLLSSFVQTALVFAASGIQYSEGKVEGTGAAAWAVISMLGFSSGAQVAMARSLQVTEITTAMATSTYVDVFMDENLLRLSNRARNRRILFLLSLFTGSFAGAFAYGRVGSTFALLISAGGKLVVTLTLLFNKAVDKCESAAEMC